MHSKNLYDAYQGDEPFLFVSYSHADTTKVENILRILFRQGLRIWYDQRGDGIDPAESWEEKINKRIDHSRMFLVFLSNGTNKRPEVIREVLRAIKKQESEPSYRIIVLFLERMPYNDLPEEISTLVRKYQYIELYRYNGITEAFIRRLLGPNVWLPEIVDDKYRQENGLVPWAERTVGNAEILENLELLTEEQNYIYPQGSPRKANVDGLSFYRVTPEDIDPDAVYPLCMDNQWCPPAFFHDKDFRKNGFLSEKIRARLTASQTSDIFRALLHNWQIIVNRAFLFNSRVFLKWYSQPGADRDAFCHLLEKGAIIVYLFRDHTPCDQQDYDTVGMQAWREICRQVEPYCLRMDWESDIGNRYQSEAMLARRFHNLCLTMTDDKYRLQELMELLGIPADQEANFRKVWGRVRKKAIEYTEKHGSAYVRQQLYKDFIVRKDSDVSACLINWRKPFVKEIKQIMDYSYTANLSRALDLRLWMPDQMPLRSLELSDVALTAHYRELTIEELLYAALSFSPNFLQAAIPGADEEQLTLSDVYQLRNTQEWKSYLQAVTYGRKRSQLNEVDFYDIAEVWEKYHAWMCKARDLFPSLNWRECPGSVSILYRIGEATLTTVYRVGEQKIEVLSSTRSGHGEENQKRFSSDHKTVITIDYVCGDVLRDTKSGCLLTELRLFEGVTHGAGQAFFLRLKEKLCAKSTNGKEAL